MNHSKRTKHKISLSLIGYKRSRRSRKKQSQTMTGRKGILSNGYKHGKCCKFPICRNCSKILGNYNAKLCLKCFGLTQRGKNNPNFKHGLSSNKNYYQKFRRNNNINFKILCSLRSRLWNALKQNIKSKLTMKLLGCTIPKLKKHLKKTFKKGMSWNNYGRGKNKWCIDHIIPCCKFNLSKLTEQRKCFHYTNLQSLWFIENCRKHKQILKSII